ncbi:MAG: TetR/AcrR family transcriptional regulator [bacterium]|nr:TetR/AcrR family transcriptional regulator [bacterium]
MSVGLSRLTRASKKARTRERILANAIALFSDRGIRRTRLAEVASASQISEATLFNYFPTKGRLAEAWVRGEVAAILARVIADSLDRDGSLRSAIRAACREIAGISILEPALRFEAWQEVGRAVGTPQTEEGLLAVGLRAEQKRERVRADIPAVDLAEILQDAIEGGLIAGLRNRVDLGEGTATGAPDEADLFRAIRSRVDLVLDGFRKRNERVSAPAPRSASLRRATRPGPRT